MTRNKLIVDCATLAGKVMLESNAESYRVEETILRILETSGLNVTEAITMTTGIIFTLDDPETNNPPFTVVRRIYERNNQLRNIQSVNNISRALTAGQISPQEAYDQLLIVEGSEYSQGIKTLGSMFLVLGFTILLGGLNLKAMLVSLFTGLLVGSSSSLRNRFKVTGFLYSLFTTTVVSFLVYLIGYFIDMPSTAINIVITASFMPMYPGTSLTNGIRDTLKGDYISGVARIIESIVVAISLALGVAVGLTLYNGVMSWI